MSSYKQSKDEKVLRILSGRGLTKEDVIYSKGPCLNLNMKKECLTEEDQKEIMLFRKRRRAQIIEETEIKELSEIINNLLKEKEELELIQDKIMHEIAFYQSKLHIA